SHVFCIICGYLHFRLHRFLAREGILGADEELSDEELDPEEDPEEYEDDETKDGPVDYPMDEGDDGDGDDAYDKDEDEEDEEEHLAPADFAIVIPTAAISLPPEAEVERLQAMPNPPPSPLMSLLPPSAGDRLARMASTQALIDAVTAALPSPPLPPPLYIPPPVDHRDDVPKTEMPPRKRLCLSTLGSRYVVGESSTARPTKGRGIDYGDTWVDLAEAVPEIAPMTLAEQVDLLMKDRIAHQETILIVEEEAYAAREAWAHSIGLSQAVHSELQTYREQVYTHEFQLHVHLIQLQLQGTLIQTQHQAELLALREHPRRARQPGSDARVHDHQDAPRDTDNHI
nr:hypothetical protein [Tanacetum cinerariifolium]